MNRIGIIGFGALLIVLSTVMAPPAGLTAAGLRTFALLLVMALFWFTEALPITATGLLPVLVLPLLGAGDMGKVAQA